MQNFNSTVSKHEEILKRGGKTEEIKKQLEIAESQKNALHEFFYS